MNKIGVGAPNDDGPMQEILDFGFGAYLLIHSGAASLWQANVIRQRDPKALILVRRVGGLDTPESLAQQIADWYPTYHSFGITDWMPWNELDRIEEGGHNAHEIASVFRHLVPLLRQRCPGIRIHWPAAAHEPFYGQIGAWKSAAELADVLDGHWYVDADGIDALGRFFESHFPGKPWCITEYSSVGLNAPAPRRGIEQDAYEACKKTYDWHWCEAIYFFIARWQGHEQGGHVQQIFPAGDWPGDPRTQAGLRRAIHDFVLHPIRPIEPSPPPVHPTPPPPTPTPGALQPLTPEQMERFLSDPNVLRNALPPDDRQRILDHLGAVWGYAQNIRRAGFPTVADRIERGVVDVKNAIGEP